MGLATSFVTTKTNVTTAAVLYTTPTATALPYGRDLVITNSGSNLGYVCAGVSCSGASATSGFPLPAGGTAILTECQVAAQTVIYGYSASGTNFSVGWGSNVAYS